MNTRLLRTNSPRQIDTDLARIGFLLSKREELKAALAIIDRKLKTACARRGLSEAQLLHIAANQPKP